MKALTLLSFLASFSVNSLSAEDARPSQTIPAKAYHVILHANQQWSLPQVIGRIPEVEQMEIRVSADKVTSDKSVSLTGNAVVTVSVGGKAITTYEGPELVLTPVDRAAAPLTYEEGSKQINELDKAIARRDTAQVLGFFAEDARITVEALTPTGTQTRSFTREQYGDYLKSIFPAALRIQTNYSPLAWNTRGQGEQHGTQVIISKDGLTAEIASNARFAVTIPEGEINWDVIRKITAEKRGEKMVITSLDVKLPKQVSENWPEPKQPLRIRPAPVQRAPLPSPDNQPQN